MVSGTKAVIRWSLALALLLVSLHLGITEAIITSNRTETWWPCLGRSGGCTGYEGPCEPPRKTVDIDVLNDLIEHAIHGKAYSMYPLLSPEAHFELPQLGIEVRGRRNISIYLASQDETGSRSPYYHVYNSLGYVIEYLQEGSKLMAVVNQTVTNALGGSRFDLWVVEVDRNHRVSSVMVLLDSLTAGSTISTDFLIDEARIISTAEETETNRPYSTCLGQEGECAGYQNPCEHQESTLLKEVSRYLAEKITVERRYDDIMHILTVDAYQTLPAFNVRFDTAPIILSYQYTGDPTRSNPIYLVENVTIPLLLQRDGLVVGIFDFWFYAFHTGVTFRILSWWYLVYRPDNTLYAYIQHPDTRAVVSNLAASYNTSVDFLCSGIAAACTNENAQYPVPEGEFRGLTCEEYLSSLPDVASAGIREPNGRHRHCVSHYLNLSLRFPSEHCRHTGGVLARSRCSN